MNLRRRESEFDACMQNTMSELQRFKTQVSLIRPDPHTTHMLQFFSNNLRDLRRATRELRKELNGGGKADLSNLGLSFKEGKVGYFGHTANVTCLSDEQVAKLPKKHKNFLLKNAPLYMRMKGPRFASLERWQVIPLIQDDVAATKAGPSTSDKCFSTQNQKLNTEATLNHEEDLSKTEEMTQQTTNNSGVVHVEGDAEASSTNHEQCCVFSVAAHSLNQQPLSRSLSQS